ncbi:MAG: glycosyltransferase, partial [Fusobacterium sp.]
MNILMALSQLEVTGAEVYGVTLADELINRGNKVMIVSDTLTKKCKAEYIKLEFNKRGLGNRINQVKTLLKIIRENDIQVVHAHSRASSWSSAIACKIAGIPLVTSTHGRQPVHLSRKVFKAFGDLTIPVCENIQTHLVNDLGVKPNKSVVLRNPIDTSLYSFEPKEDKKDKKIISIIGRLSGPKGDVAYS